MNVIMLIFFVCLLYFQVIHEACSVQLLLSMEKTISLVETENKTRTILVKDVKSLVSWDYHYDKGYLYYVLRRHDHLYIGDLKRLHIRDKTVVPLPFSTDNTGELEVAVDWVRDEIYVVTAKDAVIKADLDGQNRREVLAFKNVKSHLGWRFADANPYTAAFNIDPYEGLLFLSYNSTSSTDTDLKHVILRADLNGKELKLHRGYVYYQFMNTVVDVSASYLYLIRQTETHVFSYEDRDEFTKFKLSWENVETTRLADAFQQRFYMAYPVGTDINVYEYHNVPADGWEGIFNKKMLLYSYKSDFSAVDFCKRSHLRTGCIGVGVLVYDPRRQRRLRGCKFECKRKDCGHQCEVRQDTGDTCICPPNEVLRSDQRTCEAVPCTVPNPSGHRVYRRYPCSGRQDCEISPGASVPHADPVAVTCDPGYYSVQNSDSYSSDSTLTVCSYGSWFPRLPTCIKLCPPLTSLTVNFTCYQGPRVVDCNMPLLPGTVVEFSCKEYHDSSGKDQGNGLTCTPLGEWSRPIPYCKPNCGKSNLNSNAVQTAILGDSFSELGNFPWHAGLYHLRENKWEAVCGGTLVSPKIILTAAHCVTTPCDGCKAMALKPQDVMIALGKTHRSLDTSEKSQVKRAIKEIRVNQDYVGSTVNYGQDIAVLVMESAVEVTNYVMPACVDFSRNYVKKFQEDTTLQGYVAGWGNTEDCSSFGNVCGSTSETLKYAKTTITFFNECFNLSQTLSNERLKTISRLTNDKFCAGNGTESVVQNGDSGGGLTFVFDGLHHVFGVVSLRLKMETGVKTFYSFGAFTNLHNYLDWLQLQFYEI